MLAAVPFTGLEGPNSRSPNRSLSSVQMSVSPDWCHKLFYPPYALASNVCATSWNQSLFSCIFFFNDLFSSALLVHCLFHLRSAAMLTVTPQGDEQSEPYPASSLWRRSKSFSYLFKGMPCTEVNFLQKNWQSCRLQSNNCVLWWAAK